MSVVLAQSALLVHDLDLLVDHLAGETIDRHAHPVMLLPFDYEVILKTASISLKVI